MYQWSDRVVRTIVRRQWMVRGGNISRSVQMVVTPTVKVVCLYLLSTVYLHLTHATYWVQVFYVRAIYPK